MVTLPVVGSTRVTLSERGMKDSRVGDTGGTAREVERCLCVIRPRRTSPTARKVRENQTSRPVDRVRSQCNSTPRALEGDQKKLYELEESILISWAEANGFKGTTDDGTLIGPFNPYLYSPGITPGFLQWLQADSKHSSLNKRVHEVVILSVGAVWRSPFELYAHSAVARKVGVPEAAIQALADGRSSDELSAEEQVAHRFARQLTAERKVDADLYREAETMFGRTGLVDMVYLIGIYLLTCALLNAFEIPAPK